MLNVMSDINCIFDLHSLESNLHTFIEKGDMTEDHWNLLQNLQVELMVQPWSNPNLLKKLIEEDEFEVLGEILRRNPEIAIQVRAIIGNPANCPPSG